jgi:DNA polymerase-3 subunit delta
MPALTQEALVAQVAAGDLQPVYLIVGDDEVAKDDAIRALQAAVPEEAQAFGAFERYSALDKLDPAAIVASARTLPFLADRKVIVVTAAERWFATKRKGGDDGAADDDDAGSGDVLEAYLDRVEPASTIAFVASDVNRTFRTVKALLKIAAIVECWGLKGDRDARGAASDVLTRAGRLAAALLKRSGMTIDRAALEPLLAHAGTDIGVLRGDVERLVLYCHGRKTVAVEDVHAVVSGGLALVDQWAIVNAIEKGDARAALRQINAAIEAGEVPYKTLGQIGWWVRSKLPQIGSPDRVRTAVDAVFRTDLAMKSSGGEPRILLERLVVELCARAGSRGGGGLASTRRAWP